VTKITAATSSRCFPSRARTRGLARLRQKVRGADAARLNVCVLQVPASGAAAYPDLAPDIFRQRLVIEGCPPRPVTDDQIGAYLQALSEVCGMTALTAPVTHRSERYGWAGWIHWETSGAHFYAWESPRLFFSVDVYTCKAFDASAAVDFTAAFFETDEIVAREW
jgi:S-adenosylmethionine decarboxylase